MKRFAVSIILSILLFSVAAETISTLFITRDNIVLTDDDTAKEEKKEQEETFKQKITGNFIHVQCRDHYLVARATTFMPGKVKDTHKGFSSLPELPPWHA